jgi:anti-sigma regulatory factor (Ser/Thr protein kinase)
MVGRRRVIFWGLAQDAQAVGKARELVRKALAEWGLESVQDVVELVVSELVTNAVRHARGPIRLCLTCDEHQLLGAVCDGDPHLPAVGSDQIDVDGEGGRGLALVEAVTHRWGTQITSTGKRVWFSLLL